MTNSIIHKANTRGHADHGWLNTYHSFSFADYHNANRMRFGALRVLNDDTVQGGMGFSMHPHDNMEIITIILKGALEHKDNMGHTEVIQENDVQVMSAGTGILHSEHNKNKHEPVSLLQLWIFPNQHNVQPRYAQQKFNPADRKNKLQQIVGPKVNDDKLWIYQDAWLYLSTLSKDFSMNYTLQRKGNGVYAFVIDGDITINNELLHARDAIGVKDVENISITANSNVELLLIDIPL